MRQTLLAVRVFGSDLTTPILNTGKVLKPLRTPIPIDVQLALEPPETSPTHCYEFVFHTPYVLAYGPFDAHNPLDANDSTSQPIDYCVYLHPSNNLEAQEEFAYGGSNIHPVEIIDFPINHMPSLNIVKEFDPLNLQFLGHMTELFKHGTPNSRYLADSCYGLLGLSLTIWATSFIILLSSKWCSRLQSTM